MDVQWSQEETELPHKVTTQSATTFWSMRSVELGGGMGHTVRLNLAH